MPNSPDAELFDAWREWSEAKLVSPTCEIDPIERMHHVDSLLFDRNAETLVGLVLKLRAALFVIASKDFRSRASRAALLLGGASER
jgi:hypothetical protein